ncbi:MAG TPA: glycoside hydrolase family 36 protein [Gammaproteobacteria bacterium]|nr:glycoside hydrolase family 36 protein [Gammaproteobacteria bacterium]
MIRNDHFAASFDPQSGTISIRRADGAAFVTNGAVCANTDGGKASTASPGRDHAVDVSAFRDGLGTGRRMSIASRDPEKRLDFSVDVVLYDRRPLVTVAARCTNVSAHDVLVTSLEPLRAVAGEGGALHAAGASACLTNGPMYYDAGRRYAFADEPPPGLRPPVKGARLANESIAPPHATVASWWNLGLFSGYDREGMVLGFLESTQALGLVVAARVGPDEISFVAESTYAPAIALPSGASLGSDRFALNVAASPYTALEDYAGAVGTAQNARTRSIVNGWCSWFYTLAEVSEEEVLRNAAFAAERLRPFGLEHIQIDEGYQRSHGDWEGNERFPHGMQWLAERIRERGLKPGIWISPYVVAENTDVFRRHPDWLVRRNDGSLQRIGNWEHESSPGALAETVKRYCLDVTHPDAAGWLRDLFDTIARRWGYELVKLDFMAWSILAAERYRDRTLSSAAVYRRGLELMRAGAGDGCHILDCGPANTTVGLVDSVRIEADINYGYADAAWKQYFQDPSCSTAAAAKRYYFHRRTWVNDTDHVCLDLLSVPQAEAAATSIALSGGNLISGDRLDELDPIKLEILKKVTPSLGEAAVAVDLFDADIPTTFVLHVVRPFGAWSVVALFNPDLGAAVERRFPLRRLGLDPARTYLAFDFWKQRFAGEVTQELRARVDAGSVTLLALHAAAGRPQLLSTSRHVAQGAIEIEDLRWDESARSLRGVSAGPPGSAHDVFVHVPGEHPWTWQSPAPFHDYAGYSLKLVASSVIRVHLRFGDAGRVRWQIDAADFSG